MEILICASARAEIAAKCIQEFASRGNLTVIAPPPAYAQLAQIPACRGIRMIKLTTNRFTNDSAIEDADLKSLTYSGAVIVSDGLGFIEFNDVIETILPLKINRLIFYNRIGHQETVKLSFGARRVFERCAVALLMGIFGLIRPIELLLERTYIRCAELLGL